MTEVKMLETVEEVVRDMIENASPKDRRRFHVVMDMDLPKPEDIEELDSHFSRQVLSRYIRNTYGLWRDNNALGADCLNTNPSVATATYRMWQKELTAEQFQESLSGFLCDEVHPDDASYVIQIALIQKLREISVNGYEL